MATAAKIAYSCPSSSSEVEATSMLDVVSKVVNVLPGASGGVLGGRKGSGEVGEATNGGDVGGGTGGTDGGAYGVGGGRWG